EPGDRGKIHGTPATGRIGAAAVEPCRRGYGADRIQHRARRHGAGAWHRRGNGMSEHEHWQSRPEGGGRFAIWLIRAIALHGGRRLARLCLYPITAYFYLRRGPERLASAQYLQRVFGRPATPWQVLKHIHAFAATILDRVFLLAHGEQPFELETQGLDLLVGSHQGSFEALRAIGARRPQMPLRVVLDKQKTPAMTELLEALAPEVGACVIDAAQDGTSIALAMAEA